MGLDITAYGKLQLVGTAPDVDAWEAGYDWGKTFYVSAWHFDDPAFPEQIAGSGLVAGGVYEHRDSFGFRAGSYGGYNKWRDDLAWTMLGESAQGIWNNKEQYHDQPFYYLINFSDCEGIIAGPAAAKLAQDFRDHQGKADLHPDNYWREKYADWRKAFELAADGGLVDFH